MESFSLIPVTFASILSSFSGEMPHEEAKITTYTKPEIAGVWELDLSDTQAVDNEENIFQKSQIESESLDIYSNLQHEDNDSTHSVLTMENTGVNQTSNNTNSKNDERTYKISNEQNVNTIADDDLYALMEEAEKKLYGSHNDVLNKPTDQQTTNPSHKCKERYNFSYDNIVKTTSGEEWTYGQYLYQPQDAGLPVLALLTTYDNNKIDCSGNKIDQTGESLVTFVDYQPQANIMRWCEDQEGDYCPMIFHKLLP